MASSGWKWLGLGLVALVGVGLARSASATPSEGEGEGLTGDGVRHGIAYEGCNHFELQDFEAAKKWGEDNRLSFISWVTKIDEIKEDPEPIILDVMRKLFPECPWPPAAETTFGPERQSFAEAVAQAKVVINGLVATPIPGAPPLPLEARFAPVMAGVLTFIGGTRSQTPRMSAREQRRRAVRGRDQPAARMAARAARRSKRKRVRSDGR